MISDQDHAVDHGSGHDESYDHDHDHDGGHDDSYDHDDDHGISIVKCWQVPYYKDVLSPTLPANGLYFVDHVVGNQPDLTMEDAAKW